VAFHYLRIFIESVTWKKMEKIERGVWGLQEKCEQSAEEGKRKNVKWRIVGEVEGS